MRQLFTLTITTILALFLFTPSASAGSPHFVGKISVKSSGSSLTVSGKEAGLGNETQVHIVVTADAQCVNRGGNHPKAGNKESFAADGEFPVQNGKATFSLTLNAAFQPDCSPPMTVVWSNVHVEDVDHAGVEAFFAGPF